MLLLMLVTLYPFLYILFASFSAASQFMAHEGILWHPVGFTLSAYKIVFQNRQIITGFCNTLIVLVSKLCLSMVLTIIGAYFFTRKNALLVPFFTIMIVFTMFLDCGLIPRYLNVKSMHLDNSLLALIIPTALTTYNLIILRTAFAGIPPSMEEAAIVDGANRVVTLVQILVPLVVPTIMVCVLYYAVDTWNAWFDAMIYLRSENLYPLQLVLREILIRNSTQGMTPGTDTETMAETIQYAVMMVATLPILLVYPFLQKYFVKGVMIGSVKE